MVRGRGAMPGQRSVAGEEGEPLALIAAAVVGAMSLMAQCAVAFQWRR
ncbi:MAG: hypothetical protein U0841_00125 [Chloroflexia bacterium]